MMTYEQVRFLFPRDVNFEFGSAVIILPFQKDERFLAFDQDQKLWAYNLVPSWSPASQKWIPQDHDTPRHIITWTGAQVNAKKSIKCYPEYWENELDLMRK